MCLLSEEYTLNCRFKGVREGSRCVCRGGGLEWSEYEWVCGLSSDPLAERGIRFPIRPFESSASSLQINTDSALSGSSLSLPQWLRQRWGKSCLCALQSHSAFAAAGAAIIIIIIIPPHTPATFCASFCFYQVLSWLAVWLRGCYPAVIIRGHCCLSTVWPLPLT